MRTVEPGTEIGGYRIEAEAGRGGMGIVYKATQLALDRTVAFKLIAPDLASDEDFRERFKRESRIAASIDDPNVIPVYEAGEEDGLLFITMRFVEGTDLRKLLMQEGRLPPERAATIIAQVGDALDAAHARELVHRDIKPGNVLMAKRGKRDHAYLTDFGLTKHSAAGAGLTKTGTWVGTLDYVAPEQIQGSDIDARTDVYALGCVLYQCLSGQVPFERDSDVAKIWAHIADPPPPLHETVPVPEELAEVVHQAMAKEPDDRFDSAGDFGRAAVSAAAGRGTQPRLGAVAAPPPPPPRSAVAPPPPPPSAASRRAPAPPPSRGRVAPAPPPSPPYGRPAPAPPPQSPPRGAPAPPPSSPARGTPAPPPPSPPRGTPAPPPSSPPRGTPAPPPSSPPSGTPAPPPPSPPRGTPAPPPDSPARGTPAPPPRFPAPGTRKPPPPPPPGQRRG